MIQILPSQNDLCSLLQTTQISSHLSSESGHRSKFSPGNDEDFFGRSHDIFSESLDVTLQLLEEEQAEDNASIKDILYENCASLSTNCSVTSAETVSLASRSAETNGLFLKSLKKLKFGKNHFDFNFLL